MINIEAIVIDNEISSREALQSLIREHCPGIEIVAVADSVTSGIEAINTYAPDLLFLNVEINGQTGFDLLEQLKEINFAVIFIAAHENYALKAFRFCAIDYLLKPVNVEELIASVKKVEKKKSIISFKEKFDLLVGNVKKENKNQRLAVPTADGLVFMDVKDILYGEAKGSYTYLHTKNDTKVLALKKIKEYEQLLAEHDFLRVHHSFIINLKEIKQYIRGEGGCVIMSDNSKVDVSKRKKELFLSKILKA